jgi:hypothetical protein
MGAASDEGVPARAALREVIAALQNLHALVRSPRVGPRALADVVPEVVALLGPLGAQLEGGLGRVEGAVEHAAAREALVAHAGALAASARAVLAPAASARVEARSRLGIELELERVLPPFEAVRELVDALEGSVDEGRAELDVRDFVHDALAGSRAAHASRARVVPVALAGPLPRASALLKPGLGRALLVGAVGWVGLGGLGGLGGEGRREVRAVRLSARLEAGGVVVGLSAADAGEGAPARETWAVRAAVPIASAPAALEWAAALCGGHVRFLPDRPTASLTFATSAAG